jgi:hypothetical protein
MFDGLQVPRTLVLTLIAVPLVLVATLHATEPRDRVVRDALLRALPRYQDIPVDQDREIERIRPHLDHELILELSDGSTYRVTVELRSR